MRTPTWIGYATIDGTTVVSGGARAPEQQRRDSLLSLRQKEGSGHAGFTAGELILEGPKLVFGIHSELISKLNNLSSSNERHLCCHDRHKHHVGIEWQICHASYSIADIIDIHTRLWHLLTIGL